MRNELIYKHTRFADDSIASVEMTVNTSLNGRSLDVDTMRVVVDAAQGKTALRFLTANQRQLITSDGKPFYMGGPAAELPTELAQNDLIRYVRGGSQHSVWFRDAVQRIGPTQYSVGLVSPLGRLSQMSHKGGVYTGIAAEDLIDEICGTIPHVVGATFVNTLLYGWLPYVSPSGEGGVQSGSAKDNLLQVLFALNASVRDNADGTLLIDNLSAAEVAQIGPDRIYLGGADIKHDVPVTQVMVLEHQFLPGSESVTLYEGDAADGQVIVFGEPMGSLTATGTTIRESGANYAVLSGGVNCTLTGTPYIHNTWEVSRAVTAAPVANTVRVVGATLVSATNSSDVVNRLADYYAHRATISVDALVEAEDAGDVVQIYDPYDRVYRSACIEQINGLRASNVMRGSVSALIGYTPWQVVPFEDIRELLTGSGTWTVPSGVTEISVVLIGGGSGGLPGGDGEDQREYAPREAYWSGSDETIMASVLVAENYAEPMLGGVSGDGGSGGKILRFRKSVAPGQTFAFSCGGGGIGAVHGSEQSGGDGSDTSFGDQSTQTGESYPSGYYDVVSGNIYGAPGLAGISGGNGSYVLRENGETILVEPTPIAYDGAQYNPGASYAMDYVVDGLCRAAAGLGGGPAAGSNGGDGSQQGRAADGTYYKTAYSGDSGDGGDAAKPGKSLICGCGGSGGNGGGGAGNANVPTYARAYVNSSYYFNVRQYTTRLAKGGQGSDGGDGADGGILIYYRRPITS